MTRSTDLVPTWTWAAPLAAAGFLVLKALGLFSIDNRLVLLFAALLLGGCVFAAVHHTEVLAMKFGEPMGSILLAIAVTTIEVALILSFMVSAADGGGTFARDTVYSAVMIVLNGVVGVCLVFGGARHHEQTFQVQGASSALGVLGTLTTLALVLPNYTRTTPGPQYAASQLLLVGGVSLALYGVFLFIQTVRHRDYFLTTDGISDAESHVEPPTLRAAQVSSVLLLLALVAVVLLAKALSYPLETAITGAGLPQAFVGVVIAGVVLLPEGLAAVKAARANLLQTSLNLALGSALATIGLTIPAVAGFAVLFDRPLVLGLQPEEMVLLLLTLFTATLTLATGRTTVLQGAVHLVIFAVFLFLSAIP